MKNPGILAARRLGFICLLALSVQALSAAEEIIVRARLDQETVWAGQRVGLQVDVLGRNGWAQAKPAREIMLPGAYILPAGNSRVRLQESIDGDDYSGQRYEWFLYPQRHGTTQIPPLDLQVSLQTWGAGGGTADRSAKTPTLALQVELLPGVDPTLPLIVSPDFSAEQSWKPDTRKLRVGDALKRIITLRASNLPAMVLPPIAHPEAPGMGMYPSDPQVEDRPDGSGLRRQTVTYVCQSVANPELPTHRFQWWNPETAELRLVTLKGRSLTITGLAPAQNAWKEETPSLAPLWLLIALIAAALACLIRRLHRRPLHEETLRFKTLLRSARHGNSPATCHALLLWIDSLPEYSANCMTFLEKHSTNQTVQIVEQLLRDPEEAHTPAEMRQLAVDLRRARRDHRKARKRRRKIHQHLPPLNGPMT